MTMHCVIGYGSLINPDERQKAGLPREAMTIGVRGFRRRWNVQASNKKTYLGVVPDASGRLNAVLFAVNEEQLRLLDAREGAYGRVEVAVGNIAPTIDPPMKAWIYVAKPEWTNDAPSSAFAVKRSYVDTVIAGCLACGEEFCAEFIATTDLWEQYWYDNRKICADDRAHIDTWVGEFYPPSRQVRTMLPSTRFRRDE